LHIPVFGVFAAVGVVAALALSQRTARYAGLGADAVWNAGVTAVVAVFVISRALLVVFNWHSFLVYPFLLLAVPSLTSLGVMLTCISMLVYLRVRGIPLRPFLDAMAPSAAMLWAFLTAGEFASGTRDGMPGRDGRVHPVELYSMFAAIAIVLVLLSVLRRRTRAGVTAGAGFLLAGITMYFADFFRVPSDLLTTAWLDPSQAIALMMVATGCALMLGGTSRFQTAAVLEAERAEDHHAV